MRTSVFVCAVGTVLCLMCTLGTADDHPMFQINNMEQFWGMYTTAQNGFSFDVELNCDLDFADQTRTMEPLGTDISGTTKYPYNGKFNGNGHTVRNLKIQSEEAGFFGALGNATVHDLSFDSTCTFTGNYAGALAARTSNAFQVEILNVHSAANVNGRDVTGGLIGVIDAQSQTIPSIRNCVVTGNVQSTVSSAGVYSAAGGIVGRVNAVVGAHAFFFSCVKTVEM